VPPPHDDVIARARQFFNAPFAQLTPGSWE
jgi:hypothetical protein